MGGAFGLMMAWARGLFTKELVDLKTAVDRNSALLVVLNEAHFVRAMQNATTQEMKDVVALLKQHLDEAKK